MPPKPEKPRRVAFMLDLEWPYKRHAGIFAGTQRYAQEQGWESTIDEYVAEKLPLRRTKSISYDGVIGRATKKLAERAARLGLPVVNVWLSSPVWQQLPGVFADFTVIGRLRAEHLLARGFRRFAVLQVESRRATIEAAAFRATVRKAGFPCAGIRLPLRPTQTYTSWQKHEQRIDSLMSKWHPPIGVFAFSEEVGRMITQMCRQRGWRVPHDVAIIAGGNWASRRASTARSGELNPKRKIRRTTERVSSHGQRRRSDSLRTNEFDARTTLKQAQVLDRTGLDSRTAAS